MRHRRVRTHRVGASPAVVDSERGRPFPVLQCLVDTEDVAVGEHDQAAILLHDVRDRQPGPAWYRLAAGVLRRLKCRQSSCFGFINAGDFPMVHTHVRRAAIGPDLAVTELDQSVDTLPGGFLARLT